MMEADNQELVRELDPFGFLIGHASAIKPLGGAERGPDPRYVFHTPYVPFRPGRVIFTVHLDRLQATFGELRVNINAFVPGSGRDAIFVTSSRVQLADKAAMQRGIVLSILAVAGATYAAYGFCLDGTDARAEGIRITAEEVDSGDEATGDVPLLPTSFGDQQVHTPIRLVDDNAPSLQDPVSQPMTADQLGEAAFGRWAAALSQRGAPPRNVWPVAFVAQALDRYGMLRAGARGLALGQDAAALAPILAASGCNALLSAISPNHDLPVEWNALPCSPIDAEPGPSGLLPGVALSLADEPPELRGFDFLWSVGLAGHRYRAGDFGSFLIEAMGPLRPGGYAIHMFDLATGPGAPPEAVSRREVERIAVTLISRNFSVAQLNFATGTALEEPCVPFGLIVRKG